MDRSDQFAQFYLRQLDIVRDQIAAILPDPDRAEDVSCLVIERDKILRQLAIDRQAGLTVALEWAKSIDPKVRERAALVLADIADPLASKALETLQHDRTSYVSHIAEEALRARRKP